MEAVYNGIKSVYGFLFLSQAERGLLDSNECFWASDLALGVGFRTENFESEVKRRYPHRTDILGIAEKVQQSIRSEYGGIMPGDLFNIYEMREATSQTLSPREVETFQWFLAKWLDRPAIEKEYSFLRLDLHYPDDEIIHNTEEHAADTAEKMKQWLLARHGTLEF
ncbi:hypothetical protein TESG_04192 [Trichophyton tonsurans CBS 112818]|uniref:Uncharacterized protein n=2 Tax=Trichophyton TaxID=5550 RepID=F2Q4B6_TRIEC|nr:hypothetical protein TESG_04192 [Trichophyton tonsurans CBS 112818]EGE08984.1 hypothetical protein TEQG_08825 [Trichophyton equinum CBS 127.97]